MYKKVRISTAVLGLVAGSLMLLPWSAAEARKPSEGEPSRPAPGVDRAAQAAERASQEQAIRAEQEQAQKQHSDMMRQANEERQQQEKSLRDQEQQARKAQQEAMKEQQQQARMQQEQGREQQQQARAQQQEQNREQQQQAQNREQHQQEAMMEHHGGGAAMGGAGGAMMGGPGGHGAGHGQRVAFVNDRSGNPVFSRNTAPPEINAPRLPLQRAIAMPVLAPGASAADQAHLQEVQRNLQNNLIAVSAANAPSNWHNLNNLAMQSYFNNYQANIANQMLTITRENTFLNGLNQSQWPYWYQPQPGWQFCNGFTLANSIVADLNWLRWGWHPYYGPQPEGFVCASNYIPTPWIYMPAYGTWRQPGVNSYAAYGPPYDYTGPVSVEVFEPRTISVNVPFGGLLPQRVINAIYMYNAFYYPEFGRYGYMNRHNNWIWLNLNQSMPGSF